MLTFGWFLLFLSLVGHGVQQLCLADLSVDGYEVEQVVEHSVRLTAALFVRRVQAERCQQQWQ